MARQRRVEFDGALYHVMARGDRRDPIVLTDEDRSTWVGTLGEMCERSGIEVHAYSLLDNHYHLVLETPEGNLVEGMRWFQNTYTRRFNVRHDLWGHLFGGRYKSILVDTESAYFSRVVDYVHLNPTRAGLVAAGGGLESYCWSSLVAFMRSPRHRPPWLRADRVFGACGLLDSVPGRKRYLERLEGRVKQEGAKSAGLVDVESLPGLTLQATLRRGWYFGSEQFKERMLGFLEDGGRSAKQAKADGYAGAQRRDHGLAHARNILVGGCRTLGLDIKALQLRKANDGDKVMLAELIASQTSVPLDWLCETLGMGSRSHCSRLINAQRRRLRGNPSLKGQRTRLLKSAIYNE